MCRTMYVAGSGYERNWGQAKEVMALLRVTGRNFVAGIWFEKVNGKWIVRDMAPILRKIIGMRTPVPEIPQRLRRVGLSYEWVKSI